MATSARFEEGTGGAAFGNPNLVRQGARAGVDQTPSTANPTGGYAKDAPSKASAAPKGNTKEIFTGLAEALNTYQQRLLENKSIEIKDNYEIVFTPGMQQAKMTRPGTETDKTKVPLQNSDNPKNQKPESNSVDKNARGMQISAGTPIVQVIDQVMKNSTYITDQQIYAINQDGESVATGKSPTGQTAWYKISVEATSLGYDTLRRDHAYNMKFVISPYAINTMQSNFFLNSRYRGSHKSYNYWFTGANNAILNFEQEFNNLYRLIISGIGQDIKQQTRTDFRSRDQYRKVPLPTSEQSNQGADGYEGEPAANAADFLYSPTDMATVNIRIVGDPAWMQQGEVSVGVNERTFNFNPFNADGTINYDSQEVVFDISWNRPADYNLNTGLMEVTAKNTKDNLPQENATYTAIKCRNYFTKGRFEQEITGKLLIEYDTTSAREGRPKEAQPTKARSPAEAAPGLLNEYLNKKVGVPDSLTNPTPVKTIITPEKAREFVSLPAANPQPVTSNGDVQNSQSNAAPQNAAPQTFSQSVQQNTENLRNQRLAAAAAVLVKNQNIATEK
jgi:hypothetical protein